MSAMVVVGVADCKHSADGGAVLITYALGSCIAVAIHDPVAGVGGLLHYMLPDSAIDREKAGRRPYMFADTGIPRLLHKAIAMGARKNRLSVQVAGGAQVLDGKGFFNIGKRNYLALRKILWKTGLMIHAQEVGGESSRTITLEIATGKVICRSAGGMERELEPARRGKGVSHVISSAGCR